MPGLHTAVWFHKSQRTQTSLRRLQDVLKRSRRLTTKQDVVTTSWREDTTFTTSWRFTISWRRPNYVVLKTSHLHCLEDIQFRTSWRRLIYDVLWTSNISHLKDARFTSSWKCPIYDVLKTSVKRRLCSKVPVTSKEIWRMQRGKKWLFFILHCLKYSENFECSCLY